jgi:hypothetical protein
MINYSYLVDAIEYYKHLGYSIVEVPWVVSPEADLATKPAGVRLFETFAGCLVASGEQSFVQLMLDGKMPLGKSVCITPCFRDEPVLDDIHRQYFMKVELIDYMPQDLTLSKISMLYHAMLFFSRYVDVKCVPVFCEGTDQMLCTDIVGHGLELGSYGYREFKGHSWVYGTGCAEPRLSQAVERCSASQCPHKRDH